MIRNRLSPLIAATALVALAACGGDANSAATLDQLPDGFKPTPSRSAPSGAASTGTGKPASTVPSAGASHNSNKPEHKENSEFTYTAERPPPETFRDPDVDGGRTGAGKLRLQLKIVRGCIEPGESITVTMKTKPDSQVAFFTQFKEAPSGKMRVYEGRTDSRGLYSATVPSDPDQMPYEYVIQAAAADDKGSDGGHSGQWLHVVAEKGGCNR